VALNEAERATTLLSSATDPLSGPTREEVLALIQMMFGRKQPLDLNVEPAVTNAVY